MPRGLRKRGKKHKKSVSEDPAQRNEEIYQDDASEPNTSGEPSWIIPASSRDRDEGFNPEAPFGYVDTEVKAYFRTVDVQIREWQESREEEENENVDIDPNEQRRLFFVAALTEIQGKEKQLATDPDCSVILERMTYSMDDFVRRVFMDSMSGSYDVLVKHRFASHVCQTLFTLAKGTITREMRGIYPPVPPSQDKGELRTLKQLILDICEELVPSFSSLIMDPFASHVIRSLLVLLCPNIAAGDQTQSSSLLRSKKSAAWKSKQGSMKSVFEKGKGKEIVKQSVPSPTEFREMARKFVEIVRTELDENEVRAMAANKVASPSLQILLEVEAEQRLSTDSGSLMDRVTFGIITACNNGTIPTEPSDYLATLFRDTTSSHLLEAIIARCPDPTFNVIWDLYLKGKLSRLSVHPIANFVVAKAFERTSHEQLCDALQELKNSWSKIIAATRSGVLRAAIDRAALLKSLGEQIKEAVYSSFELHTLQERKYLVPCILVLLPFKEYERAKNEASSAPRSHGKGKKTFDPLEPKIQGSLILQSLLQLPEPHYHVVSESIFTLSVEERIEWAHHSISSRIYDAFLNSSTISAKDKRSLVMGFIGYYHQLADDKLGSRIAEHCWEFADTYLKEKVARSLVQFEQQLAGSFYGKFFARNLNLHLLRRNPEQWRTLQSEKKKPPRLYSEDAGRQAPGTGPKSTLSEANTVSPEPKKKRKRQEDEIDMLFNASLGGAKKATLSNLKERHGSVSKAEEADNEEKLKEDAPVDKELQDVLSAIKAAPKSDQQKNKRKRNK